MSLSPYFKTPFTDITGAMISHQWYGKCAKREMDMIDCFEAYGLDNALNKCHTLIEDFKACSNNQAQVKRTFEMRWERDRQYYSGERTKENRYAPSPRPDSTI
ncbi:uncharacterized protein [Onthophagus taurus]|uniref:uncharacterized protein n=1 Tax=Onthophagus taurus TaxID=166361 RepID=UPI000C20CCF2|nr:uncharacterized protein LOC111417560 [Onthophagus taurus]